MGGGEVVYARPLICFSVGHRRGRPPQRRVTPEACGPDRRRVRWAEPSQCPPPGGGGVVKSSPTKKRGWLDKLSWETLFQPLVTVRWAVLVVGERSLVETWLRRGGVPEGEVPEGPGADRRKGLYGTMRDRKRREREREQEKLRAEGVTMGGDEGGSAGRQVDDDAVVLRPLRLLSQFQAFG